MPTEVVVRVVEDHIFRRAQGAPEAIGDLGPEPVDAPLVDEVLESGVLAVVSVAMVALNANDGVQHIDQLVRCHRCEGVANRGKVSGLLWLLPMPPPTRIVKRTDRPAVGHRHDADVVGVDVDAVVAR